ncbi:hypothetical protein F2Q69_00054627 [Brassica cretica]|uniref:Uncharacterized protein n=1 Tax=Brassica cretica TaxID=69181 RepID=A0A8S9N2R6_BRACR|nr:hypothetical protein F2Q69_00054627 [Brassica cretica]
MVDPVSPPPPFAILLDSVTVLSSLMLGLIMFDSNQCRLAAMRGRSYTPSPPRGYGRRGRTSPSPRGGRYGGRSVDLPTSLLVRNLRYDCRKLMYVIKAILYSYVFAVHRS